MAVYCRVKSGISHQSATDVVYPPRSFVHTLTVPRIENRQVSKREVAVKPLKASYLPVFPVIALRKNYPGLSRKPHTLVRDLA
jgi:hypothetical protein